MFLFFVPEPVNVIWTLDPCISTFLAQRFPDVLVIFVSNKIFKWVASLYDSFIKRDQNQNLHTHSHINTHIYVHVYVCPQLSVPLKVQTFHPSNLHVGLYLPFSFCFICNLCFFPFFMQNSLSIYGILFVVFYSIVLIWLYTTVSVTYIYLIWVRGHFSFTIHLSESRKTFESNPD